MTDRLGLTDEDAETAIFQALGAASMCWDPTPTGVFDSRRAENVGEELIVHLRRLRLLPDARPKVAWSPPAEEDCMCRGAFHYPNCPHGPKDGE